MRTKPAVLSLLLIAACCTDASAQYTEQQLGQWLKRFPAADTNKDGRLTSAEADAHRAKLQRSKKKPGRQRGVVQEFKVDAGWQADRFPDHAVCYKSPQEIAKIYAGDKPVIGYPKPDDGALRIVGTGHSFMAPGYQTLPRIAAAAGLKQPALWTHTGGGMTGSARYKWEQENGIFQFDGKPTPKLLAAIANSQWDAMMWGPYYQDRPEYYACWIEFCLQYNPQMKFYLADAWPQLEQLDKIPTSEQALTPEVFARLGREKHAVNAELVKSLNKDYANKVFVMPTSEAMVLAVDYYHRNQLPGVEGVHALIGKKERSLWRDRLGHLGPGLGQLEGYVFYATIYGRSPELIDADIHFDGRQDYPTPELDRVFRKIAWQAVLRNPLSGVTDKDTNGVADDRQ